MVGRVVASDRDRAPFNFLSYEVTGDGTTPVFFDVDSNGNILVKSSLLDDTTTDYNIRVIVRDGGRPPKTATATGKILITKNRYSNKLNSLDIEIYMM